MRLLLIPLFALALAGCMGSGDEGQLALHVTDAPDDIGDFASLNVTVEKIVLHKKGSSDENDTSSKSEHAPSAGTFDLTKLVSGNVTTIFADAVPAGDYGKLTLFIRDARGVLVDGGEVDVKAPSGRLFVNTDFTITEGEETDFLFDIQVHETGKGEYQFKPNATGSGPGKTKP